MYLTLNHELNATIVVLNIYFVITITGSAGGLLVPGGSIRLVVSTGTGMDIKIYNYYLN